MTPIGEQWLMARGMRENEAKPIWVGWARNYYEQGKMKISVCFPVSNTVGVGSVIE
ncbi:MAG: hypothetical protein Fur0025_08190 [Oscillatoriaceae cyanobacterium]